MLKRTAKELALLETAKHRSQNHVDQEKVIIKAINKREFFRYEAGKLIEYDLSHFGGEAIELTQEERDVIYKGAW